jgi:Kef-type K+ transport system membrane component KefB
VSITAFPVLARIVQERGLLGSPTGRMALTVAAIDDATAWCILALVVALVQAKGVASAFVTVVLALTYVLVMLFVVRPFLNRMGTVYYTREIIGRGVMASIILLILGSAVLTQLVHLWRALCFLPIPGLVIWWQRNCAISQASFYFLCFSH